MNREHEIAERLAAYPYVCAGDDARYLLARVRQLEGRLPPTSVDAGEIRKRHEEATRQGWDSASQTDIATMLTELDHWRAVAATLLSDNPDERVQAAVWETRRQTAEECCGEFQTYDRETAMRRIRRHFGLEEQR